MFWGLEIRLVALLPVVRGGDQVEHLAEHLVEAHEVGAEPREPLVPAEQVR